MNKLNKSIKDLMSLSHKLSNGSRIKMTKRVDNPGIYALFLDGEMIYIGMTMQGKERVFQHVKSKDFDEYIFIPTPGMSRKNLLEVEAVMIAVNSPKLNSQQCINKKSKKVAGFIKELS